MAAPALPALRIERVGNRLRQQPAPAFAQQRAVRTVTVIKLGGKVVVAGGRDKAIAAAPGRRKRGLPAPGIGTGNALQGLRYGVFMMVSHAGDINPYPLDGRRRFVARRIAPPEGYPIRAVNGFDLRAGDMLPPVVTSCLMHSFSTLCLS